VIYTDDVGRAAFLDQRADDTAGLSQYQSGKRESSDQEYVHLERKIESRDGETGDGRGKSCRTLPYTSFIYPGCERGRTIVVLH
jgi:hypothetical protein